MGDFPSPERNAMYASILLIITSHNITLGFFERLERFRMPDRNVLGVRVGFCFFILRIYHIFIP